MIFLMYTDYFFFLSFYCDRILLNDTRHILMDVINIHDWNELCWKRTPTDNNLSLIFWWEHPSEDLHDKHENVLIYWAYFTFHSLCSFFDLYSIFLF